MPQSQGYSIPIRFMLNVEEGSASLKKNMISPETCSISVLSFKNSGVTYLWGRAFEHKILLALKPESSGLADRIKISSQDLSAPFIQGFNFIRNIEADHLGVLVGDRIARNGLAGIVGVVSYGLEVELELGHILNTHTG